LARLYPLEFVWGLRRQSDRMSHLGDTDNRKGPPKCQTVTLKKGPTQWSDYHLARLARQRRIELWDDSA